MHDSILFATFDPMRDVPETCTRCKVKPPAFSYEAQVDHPGAEPRTLIGFCCVDCAAKLLKAMERAESREWAEEEAALAADDLDVSDLHQRRLATFSSDKQG
jgi:hypothetical protein